MNSIRVGIIGRGFGARVHAPAFRSLANVEMVGVAGSQDWRNLINDKQIDVISIATPPSSHCELVCKALEAGKRVLCEKPFGLNAAEARVMCEAAKVRGLQTAIGFQFRMEDGIAALKDSLEAGRIGTPRHIDVAWLFDSKPAASTVQSWKDDDRAGGGLINSLASHVVDYLEWVSGESFIIVLARTGTVCEISAELTGGIMATVKLSNTHSPAFGHRIEMRGDRGRLGYFHAAPFDGVQPEVCIQTANGPQEKTKLPAPAGPDSRIAAFRKLASLFIDKVSGNAAAMVPDFTAGLRVRMVLDAAQESARSGATTKVSTQ